MKAHGILLKGFSESIAMAVIWVSTFIYVVYYNIIYY